MIPERLSIPAEHVGRLVLPEHAPQPVPTDLEARQAVRLAIEMQKDVGLRVATDGEYGRPPDLSGQLLDGAATPASVYLQDAAARALAVSPIPLKVTLPPPSSVILASVARGLQPDRDRIVASLTTRIEALFRAGVSYVLFNGSGYEALLERDGDAADIAKLHRLMDADEQAARSIVRPQGARLGMRVGSHGRTIRWAGRNGPDPVARLLSIPVDRVYLDFGDDETRFDLLAYASPRAELVLGLVDVRSTAQQKRDAVHAQIERAAERFGANRMALGTRGGFAPGKLSWEEQRSKLAFLCETARFLDTGTR